MLRCIFLVDGYNLYHAIDDAGRDDLKWLNLIRLAEIICAPIKDSKRIDVDYFTAYAEWKPVQSKRHRAYVKALKSVGTRITMGNFKRKPQSCKTCKSEWDKHEEKETDVNIAIRLVKMAALKEYDRMYLVTGDTDIAPAVNLAKELHPEGVITITPPPNRDKYISALMARANNKQTITFDMIRQAQFQHTLLDLEGNALVSCPDPWKSKSVDPKLSLAKPAAAPQNIRRA